MTQEEGSSNVTFSQTKVEDQASKLKADKREKLTSPTKVVIRRLPPSMTQDTFLEQIAPVPDHDYMYFVKADMSLGQYAFARAYINFINQQDIYIFKDKFDDYVFVDNKGNEYPAVVEFAPFQKVPKKKPKKDSKCGTIEQDPDYIKFVENWNNPEEVSLPSAEVYLEEIETKEREMRASSGGSLPTTPLIEYLKQRRAERIRIRDEKREERRRRDLEKKRLKEEDRRRRKMERDKEREKMKDRDKSGKESDSEKSTGTYKVSKDTSVKLLKNPEREKEKARENEVAGSKDNVSENIDVRQKVRVSSDDSKYSRSSSYHENDSDRRYQCDSKFRNKDKFKDRKEKERDRFSRRGENVGSISSKSSSEFKRFADDRPDMSKKTELSQTVSKKGSNRVGKSYERSRESLTKSRESKVAFDCTEDRIAVDSQNSNSKTTSTKDSSLPDDIEESQKSTGHSDSESKVKETEEPVKKKYGRSAKELKTDRRIRNKDRPSMEIYRPGMRRLSVQRSSPQKDSPTSSSSPSPTSELGDKAKGENSDDGKNPVDSNESSPTEEQPLTTKEEPSMENEVPTEADSVLEDAAPSKNEIVSSEILLDSEN